MSKFENYSREEQANKKGREIIKGFKSFKTYIDIGIITFINDRFIFEIKPLPGTKAENIKKHEREVQRLLGSSVFQVHQDELSTYIVVAERADMNNELMRILKHPIFEDATKRMRIPYVVGFDFVGSPIIVDISTLPSLVAGGAPTFGKTMVLKSLVISAAWSCSPEKLSILILDNGAADWVAFEGLTHLAHPIIDNAEKGLRAILKIKSMMEERIELKRKDTAAFNLLPHIIVVIDEYPALVFGVGNNKQLKETMLNLLQRCRHAGISIIIAGQNPTKENFDLDLGSVSTRIALRCTKAVNSTTILDESGAENLTDKGDMLLLSPQFAEIQRLKGSYVSSEEIPGILAQISAKYGNESPHKLILDEDIYHEEAETDINCIVQPMIVKSEADDKIFAKIVMWSLKHNFISCNKIKGTFKIGWQRANGFLNRMHNLGIISDMYEKCPRAVLTSNIEDLPPNIVSLLERNGFSSENIKEAINIKNGEIYNE